MFFITSLAGGITEFKTIPETTMETSLAPSGVISVVAALLDSLSERSFSLIITSSIGFISCEVSLSLILSTVLLSEAI